MPEIQRKFPEDLHVGVLENSFQSAITAYQHSFIYYGTAPWARDAYVVAIVRIKFIWCLNMLLWVQVYLFQMYRSELFIHCLVRRITTTAKTVKDFFVIQSTEIFSKRRKIFTFWTEPKCHLRSTRSVFNRYTHNSLIVGFRSHCCTYALISLCGCMLIQWVWEMRKRKSHASKNDASYLPPKEQ